MTSSGRRRCRRESNPRGERAMASRVNQPGVPPPSPGYPLSSKGKARRGWRLAREGGYWLLPMALLIGVGIGKNINLVLLLGYVLLAVVVLNALAAVRQPG